MRWHFTPFSIALIIAAFVSFGLSLTLIRRRREHYVTLLALGLLGEGEWTFFAGLEAAAIGLDARILLSKIEYVGIYTCVPLFLLFGIYYVGLGRYLTPRKVRLFFVIPVIILILVYTNEYHYLWWSGFLPYPSTGANVYIFLRGPLYWIGVVYIYFSLLALSVLIFRHTLSSRFSIYRTQSLIVLLGILPPWIANILYLVEIEPLRGIDLTPIAFTLTGLMFFMGIYQFHLFDINPIARDVLFERLSDGIVLLDQRGRIIDLNAAAERLLQNRAAVLIGKPAGEGLHLFPDLLSRLEEPTDLFLETSIQEPTPEYLDVSGMLLYTPNGDPMGRLITFRDISARKRAEETEREQRQLAEALRDSVIAVNSSLELIEVLDQILINLARVISYDNAYLILIDENGHVSLARFRQYIHGATEAIYPEVQRLVREMSFQEQMVNSHSPLLISDIHQALDLENIDDFDHARSYLGVPIVVKDRVVGTLGVDNHIPHFYTQTHMDRLRMFSEHIGVAIENARLFTKVTELATIDDLTGVNNRRHFIHVASAEVKRALRYQKPLTIMMIDIDHFKQINDTCGHQTGDTILCRIGEIFRNNLREIDVCGRYGGDEFCILLPETEVEGGEQIATRLLELIHQEQIPSGGAAQRLTASIGLSFLNRGCHSLETLLHCADQALYLAKQNGRDRVETYGE